MVINNTKNTAFSACLNCKNYCAVPFLPARRYVSAGTSYGPVSVCLSVYVRLSQLHKSKLTGKGKRIELIFGVRTFFRRFYTPLKGNYGISKNKGTSLRNCVPNSDFLQFRFGVSIVETCYRLSSTKMDAQSVINWTVVGQLVDNADSELRQFIIVIIKLYLQHDSVVSSSDS